MLDNQFSLRKQAPRRRVSTPARLPQPTERQVHAAVLANLKLRAADGLVYWHCPNGGRRDPIEAKRLKDLGTLAGVGDLLFLDRAGRFFSLELKVASGGRVTEQQLAWRDAVNTNNGYAAVAAGLDQAIAILESWHLLKPSRRVSQ
jgi:hypothetical protein